MKDRKGLVLTLAAALVVVMCGSWGYLVHRTTTQLAVYHLPKSIQPFFYENMQYLVRYSVRPDQRRNEDKTEASKHFIDLEVFGDSAAFKMPAQYNVAIAKYTKDTLEKYGYVPYWVEVMKDRLTNAFRKGDKDSILFYATDLAHYIEDVNVPLHTSENHDGQLTGQKGLHSLWESTIPEIEMNKYHLYTKHKAQYLNDTETTIWTAVRRSHLLLTDLFQQEREASKAFTDSTKYRVQMRNGKESKSFTSSFTKAYATKLGNTINQQLLNSADMVADFWYTAWVDAGRPQLKGLLKDGFSKEEKSALKKEQKAFKKDELIKDSLLIARKAKDSFE